MRRLILVRHAPVVVESGGDAAGDLLVVAHGLVLALEPAGSEAMPLPAVCVVEGGARTSFRQVDGH